MKDIYIKLKNYVKIEKMRVVLLKDIAEIYADNKIIKEISNVPINSGDKPKVVVSIIDVVRMINVVYGRANVNNVGIEETIVEFTSVTQGKKNAWGKALKIAFGVMVIFFGSFVTIMTFQTDVSLPLTLSRIYELLTGDIETRPLIITLPYALGISLGAILFFGKFKYSEVTPLEVDVNNYEKDLLDTEIKKVQKENK